MVEAVTAKKDTAETIEILNKMVETVTAKKDTAETVEILSNAMKNIKIEQDAEKSTATTAASEGMKYNPNVYIPNQYQVRTFSELFAERKDGSLYIGKPIETNHVDKELAKYGGFQLMQILGLLGIYFDAVVVEFKKNLLLFRLTVTSFIFTKRSNVSKCFLDISICNAEMAQWRQKS